MEFPFRYRLLLVSGHIRDAYCILFGWNTGHALEASVKLSRYRAAIRRASEADPSPSP